jgi:hypothetical protein
VPTLQNVQRGVVGDTYTILHLRLRSLVQSYLPSLHEIQIEFYQTSETGRIEYEILTAVYVKPCNPLKVNRLSAGIYRLNFRGLIINQARNWREAGSKQSFCLSVKNS